MLIKILGHPEYDTEFKSERDLADVLYMLVKRIYQDQRLSLSFRSSEDGYRIRAALGFGHCEPRGGQCMAKILIGDANEDDYYFIVWQTDTATTTFIDYKTARPTMEAYFEQ